MATITGDDGDNFLSGTGDNDSIHGYGGNDFLAGNGGDDYLEGGTGADQLNGGDGIDTIGYTGEQGGVHVDLGTGYGYTGEATGDLIAYVENIEGTGFDDILAGSSVGNVLGGNDGNDSLAGGDGGDWLYGGSGNDHLDGGTGDDYLGGGDGDDVLNGGAGADSFDAGTGTDTASYAGSSAAVSIMLDAGDGYSSCHGGDAEGDRPFSIENVDGSQWNDILVGDAGANALSGAAGDDSLAGAAGADHLDGGAGNDTVVYWNTGSTAGLTIDLATGVGHNGDAEGDTFTGIENVTGGPGNDVINGNDGANTLFGWNGNDVLRGAAGADRLDGGTGTDSVMYSESAAAVTINLTSGAGSGGNAQGDVLVAIENVYGSSHNDALIGNAGANGLVGNAGNDVLAGMGGKDTLAGGAGADRFYYAALSDSPVGVNADRITDFSHAQGDRIDLHGIDADTTAAGDQAFHFIGSAAFTHHAGELHESVAGGVTTVSGDVNGDGVADFSINLTGSITLAAGDFVL